jgi:hypothetical protein
MFDLNQMNDYPSEDYSSTLDTPDHTIHIQVSRLLVGFSYLHLNGIESD